MSLPPSPSRAQILAYLEEHPQTVTRIAVTDVDGVLRGKYLGREKFISGMENGLSICDCILGWDVDDQLYQTGLRKPLSGWHTGYPDVPLRILTDTIRAVPEPDGPPTLWALCEFGDKFAGICPRSLLRRLVARAGEAGFSVKCGFEYEFTLLQEDSRSLRRKHYRNLRTVTQGNFGYSALKASVCADLFRDLMSRCERHGLPLEGLHTENGPGMWEAALCPASALAAADNAVLFKIVAKEFAARHGLSACFMARWSLEHQGQGGHVHLSLLDERSRPCLFDSEQSDDLSLVFLNLIAGQRRLMRELTALAAPTVNSYKRLMPDTWAPTFASWGIDNRTCALRIVGNSPGSKRVEYRVPGADANPYLTLGAALASGMYGIENKLEPGAPISGNAYELKPDEDLRLPPDLLSSTRLLDESQAARELLGDEFVNHFVMTREWEHRQFARQITDWELRRYAEII